MLFVLFLFYPSMCQQSFALLNCREIGPSLSVLYEDYSATCYSARWWVFGFLSAGIIVIVAIGAPVALFVRIIYAVRSSKNSEIGRGKVYSHIVMPRIVAELGGDNTQAFDMIIDMRELDLVASYTTGYRTKFAWFEPWLVQVCLVGVKGSAFREGRGS